MATIYRRKSTKKGPAKREGPHSYRVEFTFNRRRFHTSIRVRTKDQRDDFNANLSRMIRAAQAGLSLEPETELWAERLPDKVYDKLAAAGLIPRNHRAISIGRLIEQMRYKPISKAGEAAISWLDTDGKKRMGAGTGQGAAGMMWWDTAGKYRMSADTMADGNAGIAWFDKDGKRRISANTDADGTVLLPTTDLKPKP